MRGLRDTPYSSAPPGCKPGLFTARGFSYLTIKALVLAGIDAPERLLFADEADLRSIARQALAWRD